MPPLVRSTTLAQALALELLPRPLVAINGCFDLLHLGHVRLLRQGRWSAAGAPCTIVVLLDSDELVKRAKGQARPILSFCERAALLGATGYIDYIIEIQSDEQFKQVWEELKPDIRVRGEEYKGKKSRVKCSETVWVSDLSGMSTTGLVERIIDKWLETKELEG